MVAAPVLLSSVLTVLHSPDNWQTSHQATGVQRQVQGERGYLTQGVDSKRGGYMMLIYSLG